MTDFTQAYVGLLIQQYFEQPNAAAEISLQAASWEKVRDIVADFQTEFDLDTATGDRLDKTGKLVGLLRSARIEFADDAEYRFFLRLQIAINNGSAFMVSDKETSIQSVIQFAFDQLAYALDNKDMTLTLYVSSTFDIPRLLLLLELGLLPKPQGVRYIVIMYEDPALPFGFSELGEADPTDVGTYSEMAGINWAQVGNDLNIVGVGNPALAALNSTDVAFIDSSNEDLRTYRFDGTNWAPVGNALNIATVGPPILAALNSTDVAFIDGDNYDLRVYRFDGTNWAQVGNDLNIATVGFPALAALNGTDVAFIDSTNDDLRVYRFDGTNWAQVGIDLNIATVGIPALAALNGTDVAFIDDTNEDLRTYRFDGTNWAPVGNALNIATVGDLTLTALSGTDVAFIDDTNDDLRVYRFDGTNWAQVGIDLNIAGTGGPILAALSSTDVAFIDTLGSALRTYYFDISGGQLGGIYSELFEA